jgi:hypothetical protein
MATIVSTDFVKKLLDSDDIEMVQLGIAYLELSIPYEKWENILKDVCDNPNYDETGTKHSIKYSVNNCQYTYSWSSPHLRYRKDWRVVVVAKNKIDLIVGDYAMFMSNVYKCKVVKEYKEGEKLKPNQFFKNKIKQNKSYAKTKYTRKNPQSRGR